MKMILALAITAVAGTLEAPFRSDEKMIFDPAVKNPVSMVGRHMSFIGLVHLPHASTEELSHLSLYEFQKLNEPLNVLSCARLTNEILFIKPEFPIRIERTELFEGRFGKACEVTVIDADPNARQRRLYLTQIRSNLYAMVAIFPRGEVTPEAANELRRSILSFR